MMNCVREEYFTQSWTQSHLFHRSLLLGVSSSPCNAMFDPETVRSRRPRVSPCRIPYTYPHLNHNSQVPRDNVTIHVASCMHGIEGIDI